MAIDERITRNIGRVGSWPELNELEKNIKNAGAYTAEVENALKRRSTKLGIDYILHETGLTNAPLGEAETKIIAAIGEYAAILRRKGKYPSRTLQQIKRRGLLDAAEISVSQKKPTSGYEILADADLEDLSYERIVVDHAAEFSPRAIWFSRKTLGLGNDSEKPPAPTHSDVNVRTTALLDWLMARASEHDGIIPSFTNADAVTAIGLGALSTFGRVHGNIQSRIDFACYRADLPPLGCAAQAPFDKAWEQEDRSWAFPLEGMQKAAQSRIWSAEDFQKIKAQAEGLPGIAYLPWREASEQRVRVWAFRWAKSAAASPELGDQRHLHQLPAEVLNRATSEYVWQAVQSFLAGHEAPQFGPSTGFDLIVDGRRFPPKAIFGLALSLATSGQEVLPEHFSGGEDSICFRLLREAGFRVVPKGDALPEVQEQVTPDQEWIEGAYKLIPHWKRERAAGLARAKKAQYRRLNGKLLCERCGLDPVLIFGSLAGEACIEVHHAKVQVSDMQPGHVTSLDDLECLCANCHRFVHRQMSAAIA